jgi:hypothetical protein
MRTSTTTTGGLGSVPPRFAPPGFAAARAVADAVLHEGYLLYPYRRSSGKNRVRWQFGVVAPRAWVEADGPVHPTVAGSVDSWRQQTECLLEAAPTARVFVRLRFLQLQHRAVRDGAGVEVDELETGGQRHLTFDEAVAREVDLAVDLAELADRPHVAPVEVPGGEEVGPLPDGAGCVVRTRRPLSAMVRVSATLAPAPFRLHVLRVETENTVADLAPGLPRAEALRRSLVATHTLLGVRGGRFHSLLDAPQWATTAAAACTNLHTFPVLSGADDAAADVVLSSPILLPDHPQIAPESPGDLFDAGEIDEILTLRTLTLTDDEKREARATDPRAAAIVDRTESIPPEVFERLHGAVRSLRPVESDPGETDRGETDDPPLPAPTAPWWDPGADASVSPTTDAVLIDGQRVARGSRVRLHPRAHGADLHDMFLDGRTAHVDAVLLDVDGARHVAVTVDDDPGADLHQWYGRYRYFAPDEVEPLGEQPLGEKP